LGRKVGHLDWGDTEGRAEGVKLFIRTEELVGNAVRRQVGISVGNALEGTLVGNFEGIFDGAEVRAGVELFMSAKVLENAVGPQDGISVGNA